MATMLVEVGADVELRTTDKMGFTALMIAAQKGYDQIVRMLLERGGADPSVDTADQGAAPLFIAARNGHLDAVKVLMEVMQYKHTFPLKSGRSAASPMIPC